MPHLAGQMARGVHGSRATIYPAFSPTLARSNSPCGPVSPSRVRAPGLHPPQNRLLAGRMPSPGWPISSIMRIADCAKSGCRTHLLTDTIWSDSLHKAMRNSSPSTSALPINSRRNSLKSLLTLASGAASLGTLAPSTEAGIIHTEFATPVTVGFPARYLDPIDLPGIEYITLAARSWAPATGPASHYISACV
jgi:hypothetical protein